jgi:hypothetical protein
MAIPRSVGVACALSCMFAAVAAIGGLALAAQAPVSSTTGQATRATLAQASVGGQVIAHPRLTAGECQGLGGKLQAGETGCASTFLCVTVDKNGVAHQACITSDQH